MSIQHVQAVMECSKTKGAARAVMLVLAFRANNKGECWPSVSRIAKDAGLAVRAVRNALRHSEKLGEIKTRFRQDGVQHSSVYTIKIREASRAAYPAPHAGGGGNYMPGGEAPRAAERSGKEQILKNTLSTRGESSFILDGSPEARAFKAIMDTGKVRCLTFDAFRAICGRYRSAGICNGNLSSIVLSAECSDKGGIRNGYAWLCAVAEKLESSAAKNGTAKVEKRWCSV